MKHFCLENIKYAVKDVRPPPLHQAPSHTHTCTVHSIPPSSLWSTLRAASINILREPQTAFIAASALLHVTLLTLTYIYIFSIFVFLCSCPAYCITCLCLVLISFLSLALASDESERCIIHSLRLHRGPGQTQFPHLYVLSYTVYRWTAIKSLLSQICCETQRH